MTEPQVKIVDAETGEEVVRDANADELAQIQADKLLNDKLNKIEADKQTDKAALLAKLGITADEAKLLLS